MSPLLSFISARFEQNSGVHRYLATLDSTSHSRFHVPSLFSAARGALSSSWRWGGAVSFLYVSISVLVGIVLSPHPVREPRLLLAIIVFVIRCIGNAVANFFLPVHWHHFLYLLALAIWPLLIKFWSNICQCLYFLYIKTISWLFVLYNTIVSCNRPASDHILN
jgi:hypothetical protein